MFNYDGPLFLASPSRSHGGWRMAAAPCLLFHRRYCSKKQEEENESGGGGGERGRSLQGMEERVDRCQRRFSWPNISREFPGRSGRLSVIWERIKASFPVHSTFINLSKNVEGFLSPWVIFENWASGGFGGCADRYSQFSSQQGGYTIGDVEILILLWSQPIMKEGERKRFIIKGCSYYCRSARKRME